MIAALELWALVSKARDRVVSFCQSLLRSASISGHEGEIAELVRREMRALHYDEAELDGAGNVVGLLRGGGGRSVLLHAHMDVVDPGDPARWSHAPFAGDEAEGYLWGRGASDTKGSLAAQVYALGLLREAGLLPPGDTYMAAVVGEEVGGLGTRYLARGLHPDLAIIGEPSSNTLRRGHRGRIELAVTMRGRSAHASAPERGLNPHYSMARFLLGLRKVELLSDPTFVGNSVSPTLSYVDQQSSNVIPAEVTVHLDWRTIPGEALQHALGQIEALAKESAEPGISYQVSMGLRSGRTYTGVEEALPAVFPSFCVAADDADLRTAQEELSRALGRQVEVGVWAFTTDGGHLAQMGAKCLGFGPGQEAGAHIADERLAVQELLEATVGYMALALALGRRPQAGSASAA